MQTIQNTQPTSSLFYKFILLIETFLLTWYAVDPTFEVRGENGVNNWAGNILKNIQVPGILSEKNQQLSMFLLYFLFCVQVSANLLAVLSTILFKRNRQKISRNMYIFLKFSSVAAIITNTLLVLPLCHLYFSVLICYDDNRIYEGIGCFEGTHILHSFVSVLGLLMLTVSSVIFSLLFVDMNPFSSFPLCAPHFRLPFYKSWLKLLLPLYSIISPQKEYSEAFLIVFILAWSAILVARYRQPPYFNLSMFRFLVGIDCFILWITLNELLIIVIPSPDENYSPVVLFWVIAICLIYVAIRVVERRMEFYRYKDIKSFAQDSDVEIQVGMILNLIKHRKQIDNFMNLEGILRLHAKRCIDLGCACQHLLAMNSDNDYQEKLWYQWVKTLIIQGVEKFPKSARLKILSSNLKREKLHAQFQALFDLSSISTNKWTIDQEYAVFKGQDIIEQQMIMQDKLKSEERGVDFNKVISFHKNVGILEALLIEATESYLSFWIELLQAIPRLDILDRYGGSIITILGKISKKYRKLTKVNPYNNELIKMYGSFQKEVVNNQKEAKRELEKLESTANTLATKRLRHNSEYKIIDNPNICLLTVSGHFKTMGLVKDVTNEITKILGYSKSELIGQNINVIMPRVIRDTHDQFMLNYFETSHANTIGLETRVFPLNKSGYIQPCTILVHLVPNLNEGITLIGFLAEIQYDMTKQKHYYKDASRVYYIMYNAGTQVVQGISETCYEDFGIPSSLIDETEMTENFTLDKILPEIEDLSEEELKGADGVATIVDTTNLHEEFLIPDPESLDPKHFDPEHQGSIQIYRRARVCAKIIEESRYGEALVRVIRLIELPDEDDAQGELAFKLQNRKEDISTDTAQTDSENSDIESVSQDEPEGTIGSLINENVGELAYIKSLTAQKSSNKISRGLAVAGFSLTFIVFGFEIFQYVIFRKQRQEFEGGFTNLNKGFYRHALLADLNFRARQLDLLAKYQLSSSTQNYSEVESAIREKFAYSLDSISMMQRDLIVFSETHQDDDSFSLANKQFLFEIMLDNTYKIESLNYESGFLKYVTAATQIRNASISNFILNPNIIDPTIDNFFIVRRNGLGPLRDGSGSLIEAYYSYYFQRIDSYRSTILIGLVVTIITLVISRTILAGFFLFSHKANYKAFSILGYVPPEITNELIEKCQKYLDQSLYSDRGDTENKNIVEGASQSSRRNDSEINKSQDSNDKRRLSQRSQDEQSNFTHQMENSEFHDVSENIQVSPMEFVTERRNAIASPGLSSHRGLLEIESARLKPMDSKEAPPLSKEEPIKSQVVALNMNAKKQEGDEKFEDNVEDRIQKLQESGKSEKLGFIIRIFLWLLPWLFVHVLEFVLFHEGFFDNVERSFEHLNFFSYQHGNIWYLNAFALEEIAEAQNFTSIYYYPGQTDIINRRLEFKSYIQSKLKLLASSNWQDLPSTFDAYLNLSNYAMNGNLCSDVFLTTETEAECVEFANGLMTQGLSMVMTTLILNSDDVIANFQNALASVDKTNSTQVNQTIIDALSTTKYQQTETLTDKLNPILNVLRNDFQASFISFLDSYEYIALIKFLVVIVVVVTGSMIAWRVFGVRLASKLILTRKILALMPFELFMKNKNFRMRFFLEE